MNVRELPPRSIKVYQLETTNWCNATCTYCPHSTHKRAKGYLSLDTLKSTILAMQNTELSLHHFGEPLLHKQLEALVEFATGEGVSVGFSTNGKGLTQERLDRLVASGLRWLRLHCDPFGVRRSSFVVPDALEFTEHRLLANIDAPKKDMVSFSGHLDLSKKHEGRTRCSFLKDEWRVVLWNGDLALCCHDIEGTNSPRLCDECDGYVFKGPRDWGHYDG